MNELNKNGRQIKGMEEKKKQKRERTRSVDSELFPAPIFSALLPPRLLYFLLSRTSVHTIAVALSSSPYQPPPLSSLHTYARTQRTTAALLSTIFRLALLYTSILPDIVYMIHPRRRCIYGESKALFNREASLSLLAGFFSLGLFLQAAAALLRASKKLVVALAKNSLFHIFKKESGRNRHSAGNQLLPRN